MWRVGAAVLLFSMPVGVFPTLRKGLSVGGGGAPEPPRWRLNSSPRSSPTAIARSLHQHWPRRVLVPPPSGFCPSQTGHNTHLPVPVPFRLLAAPFLRDARWRRSAAWKAGLCTLPPGGARPAESGASSLREAVPAVTS